LVESLRRQTEQEVRKGKIEILAELTRLRQICCDPRLLYEDFTAAACKVDMCEELIKEAVEGNNKVLVFSQFTSIFPILEEKLKKAGIAYYKLTGETPKMQRVQMAESFNEDEVPVFLISLKAGGTGLNLTGASIVIHFDPWWNIAAQNQATDRAHRIGQKNQVTVYKLIAKDTIEEKIIDLQEKKRVLAEEVLDGDHVSAATLDRETLLEILA
jgi:SNF2 family DNA or RNA helicase